MSRWWQNNSTPSMGFVYFNPKEQSNSNGSLSSQSMGDTSDFLSFDNGTPPNCSPQDNQVFQEFSPQNYSSPRKQYYRKSPGLAFGRRYSPVLGHNQSWRKNGGLTRNNSSQHDFGHYQNHIRNRNRQNVNGNMSVFFDPTCMEDPWLELEQALIEKQRSQSSPEGENSTNSKSSSNSEESDMENGSSEDSDLEKNA